MHEADMCGYNVVEIRTMLNKLDVGSWKRRLSPIQCKPRKYKSNWGLKFKEQGLLSLK